MYPHHSQTAMMDTMVVLLLSFQTSSSITTLCSTLCTSLALTTSVYISLPVEILLSLFFTHYLTQLHHTQLFLFKQPIQDPQPHNQHPPHHLRWSLPFPSTMMKSLLRLQHPSVAHLLDPATVILQQSSARRTGSSLLHPTRGFSLPSDCSVQHGPILMFLMTWGHMFIVFCTFQRVST